MNSARMSDMPAKPETLAWLIAKHAHTAPDAKAILAPSRVPLAFGALVGQCSDTAHVLAAAGFGRGSRIGIALPNGPEMAVAMLAVMSCATCVPLNLAGEEESLRYLFRRLRLQTVIVPEGESGVIQRVANELGLPTLLLASSVDDPAGIFTLRGETSGRAMPISASGPEDIALVLHTSGTTGKPKAVPLTQRNQYQATLSRAQALQLGPGDRSVCINHLFTSSAIRRSLFPPLAVGGSVVCPTHFDAERMLDWLTELDPTYYAAGPAVHRAVLEAMARRGGAPRHMLRFIVSGSVALPAELQTRVEDVLGVPLIQTYAMTEAGAIAQNPLPPGIRRPGSVGVPTEAEVAIIGDDGSFLEVGEAGEIVVRGPQVFRGYEDDPEANQQAFLGDWFRTGDRGFLEPDGYLHVTGRLKEIINRGGFKVPPSEVDAALMRHPEVAEAATFGIAHPTLGEDVMTAVVLREAAVVTPEQLRDFAFDALADFKVPSHVVPVSSIPKTSLGKVRRRKLADSLGTALRPPYTAPQDHHETIVAELFAEVLGIVAVGRFDNFFLLGGDSLRSTQITTRANARFDCRLEPTALFRRPTVAEFAAEVQRSCGGNGAFAPPPIVPLPRGNQPRPTDGPAEE